MTTVPPRVWRAATWSAAAVVVLVLLGWVAPDPPVAVAVLNGVFHLALFAALVTLWSRTVPRLRPAVLVAAVFVAVGVQAVQSGDAWSAQTRLLWADLAGIALGWALDRTYRRRPLPAPPFVLPRSGSDDAAPAAPDRPARIGSPVWVPPKTQATQD